MALTLDQWAERADGYFIDRDAAPERQPFQCHDVWLDYLYDVIGGKPGDGHAPGVEGFTVEVWRQFPTHRPALAELFTKHTGKRGIRAGDVVFWPVGSTMHPASHVAVALRKPNAYGRFECVSQNPGPATITTLSTHQAAGYLRPKTKETPMTTAEMRKLARMTADAILDTEVTRHGSAAELKALGPRTTLRTLIAKGETLHKRTDRRTRSVYGLLRKLTGK